MGKLAFLVGDDHPGWDGLWACVAFDGGKLTGSEVLTRCRIRILEERQDPGPPRLDFYFYAGGRFRVSLASSPFPIDFNNFSGGRQYPYPTIPTDMKGIFQLWDDRMTLCLAETGHPRPSEFDARDHHLSLGELMRMIE